MNNQWFSKVAVWLVIALVLFTVFKQFDRGASTAGQIGYSDFLEEVRTSGREGDRRTLSIHHHGMFLTLTVDKEVTPAERAQKHA